MKTHLRTYLCVVLILSCNYAYGQSDLKENIQMKCSEYKSHHKAIVAFPHLRHAKKYNISCGECHHDDAGEPLTDLVMGDEASPCIDCHYNPSYVTGKSYEEQLEYHTNALHMECKGCHRQENTKRKSSGLAENAPVKCNQCHSP